MTQHTPLRLAVTLGDPTGIGPEIVSRFLRAHRFDEAQMILIGDGRTLDDDARGMLMPADNVASLGSIASNQPVLWTPSSALPERPPLGQVHEVAGRLSHRWVVEAIRLAKQGAVAGIVTAPIHKGAWNLAGVTQPGHTEVLRDETKTPHVLMMLAGAKLRAVLATIHVPLMSVGNRLSTKGIVRDLSLLHGELLRKFPLERPPRIAVCGLNPHAGEGGLLGREDHEIIAPAVAIGQERGWDVVGPLPADACIPSACEGAFDAVLAMYHDQALPTVKAIARRTAVNVTLGLPFVRTSVDHGTAHDIAGQGIATEASLVAAWSMAERMIRHQRNGSHRG